VIAIQPGGEMASLLLLSLPLLSSLSLLPYSMR